MAVNLETDKWSERHTRIVMRASGEVDLIASLKAQTNRPEMSFQTRARINRPVYIVRSQIIDRTGEACEAGGPGIQPEVDKSSLQRHERPDRSVTRHDFGADKSMQNFEIAVLKHEGMP
jgi:hypothetical protein